VKIWAISDLHLSFGVPNKKMDIFGPAWDNHHEKMKASWDALVASEDLVLIPGDISWAMRLEEALPDLAWIHERPGTKVCLKGNHDYWWDSLSKVQKRLPSSIHVIQNNSFIIDDIAIAGTRLWDSPEYSFSKAIDFLPMAEKKEPPQKDSEAIFSKELLRLEMSLKTIPQSSKVKIAMTHFPPIGLDLLPSKASSLFESYGIAHVVFGHLHSLKKNQAPLFGNARGISYSLVSADWIDFTPICLKTGV
jgi:predicted phosphohydrolase